ncbi:hypothetical protein FA95DRAFT_1577070 [Auriscalpium vulgare]|uniref:Uncharacterized protein n=1 Tax=Auriscalpium vulgare TaxID=40419 RepID=A0ACB8R869_9AGAM|nr:hypothetical protein FA95DRAFT_1577070 [Auriscalpium vulgare]
MACAYPPSFSTAPTTLPTENSISSHPSLSRSPTPITHVPISKVDPNFPWIFMPPFSTLVHTEITARDPLLPGTTHWSATCCPSKLLGMGDHVTLVPQDMDVTAAPANAAPAISAKIRGVRAIERQAIEFWLKPLSESDLGRHLLTIPYAWTKPDWPVRLYRWLAAPSLPPNLPARAMRYSGSVPCEGNCLHLRFDPALRRKIPALSRESTTATIALDVERQRNTPDGQLMAAISG